MTWAHNLTGIWTGDDGAIYFIRQVGNAIWWAGLSHPSRAIALEF